MELTPLEKEGLNVLKNRASRLIKFIDLGSPNVIIANEVGLIIQIAAAVCGNEVLNHHGDSAAYFERWKRGFCMRNGCGAKLETDAELMEGYCQLHWDEEGERRTDLVSRRNQSQIPKPKSKPKSDSHRSRGRSSLRRSDLRIGPFPPGLE